MGKAPAFQFYPNDWSRDLEEHPLEIEGAWIRLCCKLWWAENRGQLTKTLIQWARILRVSEDKTLEVLKYLQNENIAKIPTNLSNCNGVVTVMSRRMVRDEKERELTRLRVKRYRDKQYSNGPVTSMKQRSSSSSSSSNKKYTKNFLIFLSKYPGTKNKTYAFECWKKKSKQRPPLEKILKAIENQKKAKEAKRENGDFIAEWKNASTWINQECWNDIVEFPKTTQISYPKAEDLPLDREPDDIQAHEFKKQRDIKSLTDKIRGME